MSKNFWDGLKIILVPSILIWLVGLINSVLVPFWDWILFRFLPLSKEWEYTFVVELLLSYTLTYTICFLLGFFLNSSFAERLGLIDFLHKLSEKPFIGFFVILVFGGVLHRKHFLRLVKCQFPSPGMWMMAWCTGILQFNGAEPKWKVIFISGHHTLIDVSRPDLIVFLKEGAWSGLTFVLSLTMSHIDSFTVDEYPNPEELMEQLKRKKKEKLAAC